MLRALVVVPLLLTGCMAERDYATGADGLDAMSLPSGELNVVQTALVGDIGPVTRIDGATTGTCMRDRS